MAKKKTPEPTEEAQAPRVEMVAVADLKMHPRNYKKHPEEQLDQIIASIQEHGLYRNIIVAKDNTILAGHGVYLAVKKMGLFGPTHLPAYRTPLEPDDPRALKILAGDNEIGKLAEQDDRELTAILRDVMTAGDLLGTGYDPQSLRALIMVSRPVEEIKNKREAEEWMGMPEYDDGALLYTMKMLFDSAESREEFCTKFGIEVHRKAGDGAWWTAWWPARKEIDRTTVIFETQGELL